MRQLIGTQGAAPLVVAPQPALVTRRSLCIGAVALPVMAAGCTPGQVQATYTAFRVVADIVAFGMNLFQISQAFAQTVHKDDDAPADAKALKPNDVAIRENDPTQFTLDLSNNSSDFVECEFVEMLLCDSSDGVIDRKPYPHFINLKPNMSMRLTKQVGFGAMPAGFTGNVRVVQSRTIDGYDSMPMRIRTLTAYAYDYVAALQQRV